MRKKYFLISFSLIAVVGVLIWACKSNLGPGGLDFSLLRKSGAFADGLIGYNGQITYKSGTRLNPSMDNAVEVFPFQDGTAYYQNSIISCDYKRHFVSFCRQKIQ